MDEELSIEELLGFHENKDRECEDLFAELEETNLEDQIEDDLLNIHTENNTNDLFNAFREDMIEDILQEMDHPKGQMVRKAIIENQVENLGDIKAFMDDAKKKRDLNQNSLS